MAQTQQTQATTPAKTQAQQLAAFAVRASYQDLSDEVRDQLKIRVLDALGCALAALGTGPIPVCRQQVDEFGRGGRNTLIGGGTATLPYASFYLTALVRYVDFMDNYLGVTETCHTADNFGAVLAAADYARADSQTFMTALALAYQVQSRITASAPIMAKGFDHTTTLAYSIAAGVSRVLGLDEGQVANAVGICGTDNVGLAIARAGVLSQWKGLASSQTAFGCVHDVRLAQRGVTGPLTVFEGPKGLDQQMGCSIEVDWAHEKLDIVPQTTVKRYNSEIHTQSAIECALQLKQQQPFSVGDVQQIDVATFQVAYDFAGGGAYGDKSQAHTKEQADHSLFYLIAVALLDGDVMPAQFTQQRIERKRQDSERNRVVARVSLRRCPSGIALRGLQHRAHVAPSLYEEPPLVR